jgi:hypothetical protein
VTAGRLIKDAHEFLSFKRAMGIRYRRGEFVLDSFVRFVAQRWGDDTEVELQEAISRWCVRSAGRKAVSLGNEFGVVRQLLSVPPSRRSNELRTRTCAGASQGIGISALHF